MGTDREHQNQKPANKEFVWMLAPGAVNHICQHHVTFSKCPHFDFSLLTLVFIYIHRSFYTVHYVLKEKHKYVSTEEKKSSDQLRSGSEYWIKWIKMDEAGKEEFLI